MLISEATSTSQLTPTRPDSKSDFYLKKVSSCNHKFLPVWQSDGRLIEWCNCGATQAASLQSLQSALDGCAAVSKQYAEAADKSSGKRRQEMLEAVAQQKRQIEWLSKQLKQLQNTQQKNENVPLGTSLGCEVVCGVLSPPITPMTEAQALQCVAEINNSVSRIRQLLFELETRHGYIALGFKNMSQLMQSELFSKARSTLQKELIAGRIENNYLNVAVGTFPERHFRPLSKLKPEYYKAAFDRAAEIADKRPVKEKDVGAAVCALLLDDPNVAKPCRNRRKKNVPKGTSLNNLSPQDLMSEPKFKHKQLLPDIPPNQDISPESRPPTPATMANTSAIATATNPAVLTTELTIGVLSNKDEFTKSQAKAIRNAMFDRSSPDELAETMESLSDEKLSALLAIIQPRIRRMGVMRVNS